MTDLLDPPDVMDALSVRCRECGERFETWDDADMCDGCAELERQAEASEEPEPALPYSHVIMPPWSVWGSRNARAAGPRYRSHAARHTPQPGAPHTYTTLCGREIDCRTQYTDPWDESSARIMAAGEWRVGCKQCQREIGKRQ